MAEKFDEALRCHCGRKTEAHDSGRRVCAGCDKFTDFCVGADADGKPLCVQGKK